MTNITENEARLDLFYNKETPFIFRKYLRNIADSLPEGAGPAVIHCGNAVRKILGCDCGGAIEIDPTKAWKYLWGQYSIKGLKGPCSSWTGHIGYCWEGSAAHPSGRGDIEVKGAFIDDWTRVKSLI
jgi:hypothetical protein